MCGVPRCAFWLCVGIRLSAVLLRALGGVPKNLTSYPLVCGKYRVAEVVALVRLSILVCSVSRLDHPFSSYGRFSVSHLCENFKVHMSLAKKKAAIFGLPPPPTALNLGHFGGYNSEKIYGHVHICEDRRQIIENPVLYSTLFGTEGGVDNWFFVYRPFIVN